MTYDTARVKEALRMTQNFVGFDDDMKVVHWAAMEWLREAEGDGDLYPCMPKRKK